MNAIVRFYWQHDLDLIALAVHPDFDMGKWFKKAMIAWARGDEEFIIPLPDKPQPFSTELNNTNIHFRLSPQKEDDVIAKLNGIRTGFRNSAIKLIFRSYLDKPYLMPYFNIQTYLTKSRRQKTEGVKKNSTKPNKQSSNEKNTPSKMHPKNNELAGSYLDPPLTSDYKQSPTFRSPEEKPPAYESSFQGHNLESINKQDSTKKQADVPTVFSTNTKNSYEKPKEENTDDDFDLFGALGSLMDGN